MAYSGTDMGKIYMNGGFLSMRYDAVVIGTGPAGLEAAINLKIRGKSFLLFGSHDLSRKLEVAPRIDNYLGLYGISGKELQERCAAHIAAMGIEITPVQVSMVYAMGGYFSIATSADTVEATTAILATGAFSEKLFKGEQEYLGRGVGYCATCDAPLYRGKTVAVLGYNDESVHEADFVSDIAETVYYIPVKKSDIKPKDKVKIIDEKPLEIFGDTKVTGLKLEVSTLVVDGVFVLRETVAPESLVPGLEIENGFIRTDASMRTNILGLFAAGDCTGRPHQYMRAAGQGQTAALEAVSYMDKLKTLKK